MDSFLSQWFIDISSICSVIGLLLTYAVWVKTKKIKQDLVAKTRLPKVAKNLTGHVSIYIDAVEEWRCSKDGAASKAVRKLGDIRGVLINAQYHVTSDELKAVRRIINRLNRKRFLKVVPLSRLKFAEADELCVELNSLASILEQRVRDMRIPV